MTRVLIAEDSPTCLGLLMQILESDSQFTLAGTAKDGHEAVALTKQLRPDVVVMDIHMPSLDGFEATRQIMIEAPTPIIIVSSSADVSGAHVSMQALQAGALTVLQKPALNSDFAAAAAQFTATVHAMARVRVVRRFAHHRHDHHAAVLAPPPASDPVKAIAIATSTGGPAALQTVLSELPSELPVPILIVQHIAPGFVHGLASWLGTTSALSVKVAEDGERALAGMVYLAPDDVHLGLTPGGRVQLSRTAPIQGFRPSANALFESIARSCGPGGVAVILTGMGNDGVDGLRGVHAAGGRVIAQDEASCVVFGMPGAAIAAGVTNLVLPLEVVAASLRGLLAPRHAAKETMA